MIALTEFGHLFPVGMSRYRYGIGNHDVGKGRAGSFEYEVSEREHPLESVVIVHDVDI